MEKKKIKPPFVLLIISALLVVFGVVYNRFILVTIPEQQQIDNVILTAVTFISIFVAILLVYIFLINLGSQILSDRVPLKIYKPVNLVLIAGILLSVLMMMQPFSIFLYRISFPILLVSLFGFMFWSHVRPRKFPKKDENLSEISS
jgi:hypothetical protein